jgi:hypothetical protein
MSNTLVSQDALTRYCRWTSEDAALSTILSTLGVSSLSRQDESNIKFELIGMLMGKVIYYQNILDLHLPMACYKKHLDI